ncbi:MAG: hypothetical protein ACREEO_05960 [Phenylobacterium sp.]
MIALRGAFLAAEQPRSIHVWLDRSPGRAVLRRIALGELELSHQALDALPQTPSLAHLRALLVAVDALPERDPHLARLQLALTARVDAVEDADDRRLLRTFVTWRLLHRLRRRAQQRPTSPFATKSAHIQLAEAARFLATLRDQGRCLADATQADVDHWLQTGSATRRNLRYFLAWAAERDVAPALEVPHLTSNGPARAVDADARWALARRLLHDDTLDPADRLAGTLVVLYAQPVARIARLRTDDVHHNGDAVYLSFGRDHVLIPHPLDELVRQLPWRRQTGPSSVPAAAQWLFPGRQAGQPMHPGYLHRRLNQIGIDCRANRSAALLQLAAELPAAVLADTLNISRITAVRWTKTAGGDWTNYSAQRARASG